MGGRGPAPKPAHLRQRANKKAGSATISMVSPTSTSPKAPTIPNPDGRVWHPLTLKAWLHAWRSPMAGQWLETDADALGRLALLWDDFYRVPSADALKEIRLQSALFGLSPLDRSRLQWEVAKGNEAEEKTARQDSRRRTGTNDPRHLLRVIK